MKRPDPRAVTYYRSGEAMGTRFEVFLRGPEEEHLEAVAVALLEEIIRLDGVLSRFDPRSEIARVNREAGSSLVRVDRELFALLERCEEARQLTEGYFDVARGAALLLDAEHCTVQFAQPDVLIDLGGIGKGYALDCGREIMLRYGVSSGLLQGGTSSVLAVGEDLWPVALRHPQAPEAIVQRIGLQNRGFACSAVRHAEQKQSDVVNPLTGQPLTGNATCFVLAPNATEAEIFSTALLAMGRARASQYLESMPSLAVQIGWVEADAEFVWLSVGKFE
jgi:FAD:protein FMN transferase